MVIADRGEFLWLTAQAQEKQREEKATSTVGTPVLWREPSDIALRNLYLSPGTNVA